MVCAVASNSAISIKPITDQRIEPTNVTVGWILEQLDGKLIEWDALRAKSPIKSFEVKTIDGAGYLSNVLRLKVVFENGDHFPLILKAPTDEKIEKILADDEGKDLEEESPTQFIIEYHNQEINFYNKIGNQYTGLQLPKLYGYKQSTLNPPKHGQILLEDVTHLGMLADTKMGLNLEQCESVIKAIASFHVYTLSLPNIEEILKSMPNVMLPFREEQFGIHGALCRLDPFFNAHRQELKFYFDKGAPQEENPHLKFDINAVLSHGDLWANNMFFERKSDGSCGNKLTTILDWQACYPGTGLEDVARFICTAGSLEVLEKHEQHLLRLYFEHVNNSLRDNGMPPRFTFEKMIEIYKFHRIHESIFSMLILHLIADQQKLKGEEDTVLCRLRCTFKKVLVDLNKRC